jgi:hypothetical protein
MEYKPCYFIHTFNRTMNKIIDPPTPLRGNEGSELGLGTRVGNEGSELGLGSGGLASIRINMNNRKIVFFKKNVKNLFLVYYMPNPCLFVSKITEVFNP